MEGKKKKKKGGQHPGHNYRHPLDRKHTGFFVDRLKDNTGKLSGKIQGISLILKIQDLAIFAAKSLNFSKSVLLMKLLQISDIGIGKFPTVQGENRKNIGHLLKGFE